MEAEGAMSVAAPARRHHPIIVRTIQVTMDTRIVPLVGGSFSPFYLSSSESTWYGVDSVRLSSLTDKFLVCPTYRRSQLSSCAALPLEHYSSKRCRLPWQEEMAHGGRNSCHSNRRRFPHSDLQTENPFRSCAA